jgi:hypothetical protein
MISDKERECMLYEEENMRKIIGKKAFDTANEEFYQLAIEKIRKISYMHKPEKKYLIPTALEEPTPEVSVIPNIQPQKVSKDNEPKEILAEAQKEILAEAKKEILAESPQKTPKETLKDPPKEEGNMDKVEGNHNIKIAKKRLPLQIWKSILHDHTSTS